MTFLVARRNLKDSFRVTDSGAGLGTRLTVHFVQLHVAESSQNTETDVGPGLKNKECNYWVAM